ncbi:MAG: SURF1 family cytochrome oxidase biogenesis protein [Pseudomonadota bacterium]
MKLPLVPTIMVALTLPILLALGVWQLGRAEEKAAMLRALAAAPGAPELVLGPDDWTEGLDFRRVAINCRAIGPVSVRAGRRADGASGFAQFARCATGDRHIDVNLGWSPRPDPVDAPEGDKAVRGLLREDRRAAGDDRYVLIAHPPLLDLAASRLPTVEDIPDNHTAYAVQWFGFAIVLAAIYGIYVRGWRRGQA